MAAGFLNQALCQMAPGENHSNMISRGAKWSPDGKTILANNEDNSLRLFSVDSDQITFSRPKEDATPNRETSNSFSILPQYISPYLTTQKGECVFDFTWVPPVLGSSCVEPMRFLKSSRDQPIHLVGATSGTIEASFLPTNHLFEHTSAYSLECNNHNSLLVAGFDSKIMFFDLNRPGQQYETRVLSTRKQSGGISMQKGIISAVRFCDEKNTDIFACGSYNRSICLYSKSIKKTCLQVGANCTFGGVTQLEWVGSNLLISGHRKDNKVRVWDTRNSQVPVTTIDRTSESCQRNAFSVVRNLVLAGDNNGVVRAFSLEKNSFVGEGLQAHRRPVVSVSANNNFSHNAMKGGPNNNNNNLICTTSGSRVFPAFELDSPRSDFSSVDNSYSSSTSAFEDEDCDSWLRVFAWPTKWL
eukprot:gene43-702_t